MLPSVYCIVPVHNRKETTARFLKYIGAQDYPKLIVVIVDDGSTDGTAQLLAQCKLPNLRVLRGDGTLWWSAAMRLGMDHVASMAAAGDYVLMMNDDVQIAENFVSILVRDCKAHGNVVVGCAHRDEVTNELLETSSYRIDYTRMRIHPFRTARTGEDVDSLPARGTLYPVAAVRSTGHLRSRLFPQYLADLDYSARARKRSYRLIVSHDATLFTSALRSDVAIVTKRPLLHRSSWRSKDALPQRLFFFCLHGPWILRVTALPRFIVLNSYRFIVPSIIRVARMLVRDAR